MPCLIVAAYLISNHCEPFAQSLRLRAILYAAMGAISSMYFIYLQLRFIRELCSYCLISAVVSVLLVFAALWHFQATRLPGSSEHIKEPLHRP